MKFYLTLQSVSLSLMFMRFIWLLLLALALGGWFFFERSQINARDGESLSNFMLPDRSGTEVSLGSFGSKPMVINFWATWCGPCRDELPLLIENQKSHPEISFVFVDVEEGKGAVEAFESENKIEIPNVLFDTSSKLFEKVHARGLPTTLFVNREGKVVSTHIGEITADSLLLQVAKF